MHDATLIYPHQLYAESPAITAGRPIYLVEEPLLLTHSPIHRARLLLHKLSLDAYQRRLQSEGHSVIRLTIVEHPKTTDVFARLQRDGVEQMHIVDTTDTYLEQAIEQCGIERVFYDSPLFLLTKENARKRFTGSKRFLASFYKQLRKDFNILIDENNEPTGGQWSFDEDNRKRIPKGVSLPDDIRVYGNEETVAAADWVQEVAAEQYGEAVCWLPYTHAGAEEFLQEFFRTRFSDFGPYEDAITTEGVRLWHSTLSPLLNIGLLSPQFVLDEALAYAQTHNVPLNSLEGFVRQILGWREFIRASYEVDGTQMRSQNVFQNERALSETYWTGTTAITPLDHTIKTALAAGYTHHIERLMVAGNFFLLCGIHPHEVYRWFMGLYIDAYDWVMVPNVYGMSQFADGGSFATKPYISGANYIKKMSDFPPGDWEKIWTALYWNFIAKHRTLFEQNHRLSMMPRLLDRMKPETKAEHLTTAQEFLQSLET